MSESSGMYGLAPVSTEPSSSLSSNNTTEATATGDFNLPWWQQLFFYIIFVAMFLVAAGGNIIVIWIVLAHKRMRTVTNYFLVNLAVSDVMISLLNTPFNFVFLMYQDWWFGRVYCKFCFFISPCAISASVLTFMAIAIDRYIAIIHPLRPRLTGRIVLTIIVGIWAASLLLALPNMIYAQVYTFPQNGRTICYLHWPDLKDNLKSEQDLIYSTLLMVLNYFLPMVTLACTYARISWELWISRTIGEAIPMQAERIRSKRKVVKMMVAVVVIFGLCWLPYHAYFIIVQTHESVRMKSYIQQVYLLIYWLAMSNSLYNPIIYCLMNARGKKSSTRERSLSFFSTRSHKEMGFRQGFLQFFRFCPCRPCHEALLLSYKDRGFYSTRMSMTGGGGRGGTGPHVTEKTGDRNGSLMHTTMESIMEDTNSSAAAHSVYRMHPLHHAKLRDKDRDRDSLDD